MMAGWCLMMMMTIMMARQGDAAAPSRPMQQLAGFAAGVCVQGGGRSVLTGLAPALLPRLQVYQGSDKNLHVKRLQPGVKYTFRIKVSCLLSAT